MDEAQRAAALVSGVTGVVAVAVVGWLFRDRPLLLGVGVVVLVLATAASYLLSVKLARSREPVE